MEGTSTSLVDSVGGLFDIAEKALDMVTGQPVLFTFFCAGLIGIGIGIIRKLKH